jgi:hypothetical protein
MKNEKWAELAKELKREYPNFKYRFVCICFKDPVGFF